MKKTLIRSMGTAALVAALVAPFAANAESNFATGTGPLSATARVDFQINIPKFVSLRVGAAGATINLVTFTVPGAAVGNSVAVAGTGGDLGSGAVTATVLGNGGTVTLGASTPGPLSNGAGGTINWSEVTTTSSNGALPAPVLANGASAPVTLAAVAGVVGQVATWTYSYANTQTVEAGTYGGVNVNNGRVTYTASVL
jgi:hypothetical protein